MNTGSSPPVCLPKHCAVPPHILESADTYRVPATYLALFWALGVQHRVPVPMELHS